MKIPKFNAVSTYQNRNHFNLVDPSPIEMIDYNTGKFSAVEAFDYNNSSNQSPSNKKEQGIDKLTESSAIEYVASSV